MSEDKHYDTLPQDRIPFMQKFFYGLGALVNNMLAAAVGSMVIVLNLGLGMNPALVGLLSAIPRLTDAFTDPLVGYISDNTRSKWGRRRPYIFGGAILAGILYALLYQIPTGQSETFYFWWFLLGFLIFYLANTMFSTPWVALGFEMTPDYHERTRLMAVQNVMGQVAYLCMPWFLWFMQHDGLFGGDLVEGAAWLAIIIGAFTICVGILPAIFIKEPLSEFRKQSEELNKQEAPSAGIKDFFEGFAITLKFKPFLCLCLATFLVFNGFMMVSSFQNYVIIYYVFGGDIEQGSEYAGWVGTISAIATFCVIMIISKYSVMVGKRKALFVALTISIVGYCSKWFLYNPEHPWLMLIPAPLIAFGLGSLFTLMQSMIADVCDADELNTGQRREGMYGSIFWWVVKLGMAAALAAGGFLLNATGFDVALEGNQTEEALMLMRAADAFLPAIFSVIAIGAMVVYPITEEKAHDIREALEKKRGVISVTGDGESESNAQPA